MLVAKDLISQGNVIETYTEGKHVCFLLKNGFRVKLDPNKVPVRGSGDNKKEGK